MDTSYPRGRKGIWPVVGRIIGRISIGGEFGAHEVSTGVRRIKIQIHVRRQVHVEGHEFRTTPRALYAFWTKYFTRGKVVLRG